MDLFDDIERTEHRVIHAKETSFSYLNMSARVEAAAVRTFLLDCLQRYPTEHRDALVARLRSINTNHDAAIFELLVHELLLRSGQTILAVEPPIKGRTTSPDYLVQAPDLTEFIVECVVANDKSDSEAAAERRLLTALDVMTATPSPYHYLSINVRGRPNAPVTLRALRGQFTTWIAALPQGEAAKRVCPFVYEQCGLWLRVTAIMLRSKAAEPGDPSIAWIGYGAHSAQPGNDLRCSLLKKANRYGDLGQPYLIAVNGNGIASGERDLFNALLGSPVAILSHNDAGIEEVKGGRDRDGVWTDGQRARKRGISAVLSFDGASAWRPWGRGVRLVRNPWTNYPLPDLPLLVRQLNPDGGKFVQVAGQEGPALFGLDEGWPE